MTNELPLNVVPAGTVTSPRGFLAGAVAAGIKHYGQSPLDLGLLYSSQPCTAAGVFTTSLVRAAPVALCEERLRDGHARAVLVNSGCANACTGAEGMANARATAALVAEKLGLAESDVLVASTGVIGVQLPVDKMRAAIGQVELQADSGHALARAIMTTDTRPKQTAVTFAVQGTPVTVGGIAKGAGMIHPNMATMLSFITTDAAVAPDLLRQALRRAVDASFNMTTIDGDTSTNDTVLLLANGAANVTIAAGQPAALAFQAALDAVCVHLARSIAADGEGATRLIEVTVDGALTLADARAAARTIASSNLVKSAVHGADPNWGRILAAAGRSGARLVEEKVGVLLGDVAVMAEGRPLDFDEAAASATLRGAVVRITVHLNLGEQAATAWGCDLSAEYVAINSEYKT